MRSFSVPGRGSGGTIRPCPSNMGPGSISDHPPLGCAHMQEAYSGSFHRYTIAIPYAHHPLAISNRNASANIFVPAPIVPAATVGDANESLIIIEGLGATIRGVTTAVLQFLVGAYCMIPLTTPQRFSISRAMHASQTPKHSFVVDWLSSCRWKRRKGCKYIPDVALKMRRTTRRQ